MNLLLGEFKFYWLRTETFNELCENQMSCLVARVAGLVVLLFAMGLPPAIADQPSGGATIVWVNEQPAKLTSLPPGTTHRTFVSKLAGTEIGYCVYCPCDGSKTLAFRRNL